MNETKRKGYQKEIKFQTIKSLWGVFLTRDTPIGSALPTTSLDPAIHSKRFFSYDRSMEV